jgi:glutathione S-transferase
MQKGLWTMGKLYYASNACSQAPYIVLEWIGAPYEAVRVQCGSEELLSINPAGAVPTFFARMTVGS